ncbi:MAG: efflux RND transporter periplasmic adaptor subunit [Nannocystaceae bacterium]|nr:HlyD family efflux transporter periplasmic adaptor subunit [bacterium]
MKRLLGLVLAAALGCDAAPAKVADAQTVTVERGPLVIGVEVSGEMKALDSQRISPPPISGVWNFKIAMMAEEGLVAKEGQPVLMLDTTELKQRLDAKQAERDSAATQLKMKVSAAKMAREDEGLALAQAKAELKKAALKADAPEDITAVIELEKSKLDLELARKKVEFHKAKAKAAARRDNSDVGRWRSKRDRAQQRVEEITRSIEAMTVLAPREGTVIYTTNWRGEKKKVGDTAWRGDAVLSLASLDAMEGEGEVDEVDVSKVHEGMAVSLRLDAQADVELRGRIVEISRTVRRASPENPLKVAQVRIELEPTDDVKLRPGMRFRGTVESERIEDALLLPLEAIMPTADGPVVYRKSGLGTEAVPVELGRRTSEQVEVLGGLDEGDEVVMPSEVSA